MSIKDQKCKSCNAVLTPAQIEERARGERHGKLGMMIGTSLGLIGAALGVYFGVIA